MTTLEIRLTEKLSADDFGSMTLQFHPNHINARFCVFLHRDGTCHHGDGLTFAEAYAEAKAAFESIDALDPFEVAA